MRPHMPNSTSKDKIQQQIQQSLKRVYEDVASEPVPTRFEDLLAQLRQQDAEKARPK
jgi:hypothetical protein